MYYISHTLIQKLWEDHAFPPGEDSWENILVSSSSVKYQFEEFVKLYRRSFKMGQKVIRRNIKSDLNDFDDSFWRDTRGLADFMTNWFKGHDDDGSALAKAFETAKIDEFKEMRRSLIEVLLNHETIQAMRHNGDADLAEFSKSKSPFFRLIVPIFGPDYISKLEPEKDVIAVKPGAYILGDLRHESRAVAVFQMLLLQGVSWTQTRAFLDLSEPEQLDCMNAVKQRRAYHTDKVKLDFWVRKGDWPPEDGGVIRRDIHDRIIELNKPHESERETGETEEPEMEDISQSPAGEKRAEPDPESAPFVRPPPARVTPGGKRQHTVDMARPPATAAPAKKKTDNYLLAALLGLAAVFMLAN